MIVLVNQVEAGPQIGGIEYTAIVDRRVQLKESAGKISDVTEKIQTQSVQIWNLVSLWSHIFVLCNRYPLAINTCHVLILRRE